MDLKLMFSLCGRISMIGWLMLSNFSSSPAGANVNSLAGVAAVLSVPELLLAGWIHYLAFDLFVGAWEIKDGQANNTPH